MTLYSFYVKSIEFKTKAIELKEKMQRSRREAIERRNNALRTGIIIKEIDE